jgi:hypothetical protein
MFESPGPGRLIGGALSLTLAIALGCGGGSSTPAAKTPPPSDDQPAADAGEPSTQKPPPKGAPDAQTMDPGTGPTVTPDASASSPDTESPPSSVPEGSFSNPAAVKVPTFPDKTCPVAAGASTAAINAAIASCSMGGGGTVSFAPGTYSVGSIHMASNVKLALNGATLRGGGGIDAAEPYTTPIACQDEGHRHWHNALVWGENVTNIAIVGPGTLDGGGLDSNNQKLIAFKSSSVMLFENFNHTGTGHFGYLLTDCHHITMSKFTMHPSRDGVDLMQCTDVNAHDLTITGGPDDAFALKSDCTMNKALPTDNITVTNSTLGSGCTALQIGSETWGNFSNISWSHIKVVNGGKSGIGIQMNDGAVIKNMSYDDITLTGTSFPIFMSVTSLLRAPTKMPGHAENIHFSNITASGMVAGNNHSPQNATIVISGEAGIPHQGIVLEHIKMTFPGGGAPSGDPPEGAALKGGVEYNPRYITPMPAYGVFMRHATGVEFHDVKLSFGGNEGRPAIIARDVDGLVLDALSAQKGGGATMEADAVKNLTIKGSAPLMDAMMPSVDKMSF